MLIDEIHNALRPKAPPITATLAEADNSTDPFTSASPIVPLTVFLTPSASFSGVVTIDIKIGEEWKEWLEPVVYMAPTVWSEPLPEGTQIRARLASVSAGSVDVIIMQGRS